MLGELLHDEVIGGEQLMKFFEEDIVVIVKEPLLLALEHGLAHHDAGNDRHVLEGFQEFS